MPKDYLRIQAPDEERQAISIFIKNIYSSQPDFEYETDARVFRSGSETLLFSTDEFSSEDNFRARDPHTLGWNLCAATLSDILAAGGSPSFFGHAVTLENDWDESFINKFSQGIARCLSEAKTDFLGGDIGHGEKWSYTGIAIGNQITPLNRRGAHAGDAIYMTGSVGAGNLEAALKLYSDYKPLKPLINAINIRFPLRIKEASLVRNYATCCIDSSDGLLRALMDLSRINQTGFSVSGIPFHREGLIACKLLRKPKELLFMGECGEYELVFTVPQQKEESFLADSKLNRLDFNRLGILTEDRINTLKSGKILLDLTGYSLFARNYKDVGEYIDKLVQFIKDERS